MASLRTLERIERFFRIAWHPNQRCMEISMCVYVWQGWPWLVSVIEALPVLSLAGVDTFREVAAGSG